MRKFLFLTLLIYLNLNFALSQTYQTLYIPDTLSGTTFNLSILPATKQFRPGSSTTVWGMNGSFCSPTLIFNKGDTVHLNVANKLKDTTTVHWHGFHLPAIMDGGPHQTIPPDSIWSPFFKVMNNASTYWYHPHLHTKSEEQITRGLVGLIIVRDAEEAKLNLPRSYGIDDIPLMIADRQFDRNNQFVVAHYGDTMMVNRTLNPEVTLPAQIVRLRVLNEATTRAFNLGFSDNRSFYVIATDGGLLDAPVAVTRLLLSSGERAEILVDFNNQQGQSLDLKAYNADLEKDIPGSDARSGAPLGAKNFNVLHINVAAATSNPVTAIPQSLTKNKFLNAGEANVNRRLELIADASTGQVNFDGKPFDMNVINYEVNLNDIEIWELHSKVGFIAHPFHVHDVQFNILSRNGQTPPAYEQGWKDVVNIRANETVRIIMKFSDYTDHHHPYMFHCHTASHEDKGMMGQFVVVDHSPTGLNELKKGKIEIYPNPGSQKLFLKIPLGMKVSQIEIFNVAAQSVMMIPSPVANDAIDISGLPPGFFFMRIADNQNKSFTLKFFKY